MSETRRRVSRGTAQWLLIGVAITVAGCNDGRPQRVPVTGVVKIDGIPLSHGFVTFIPNEGRSSASDIDENGRFTLTTYEPGDGALIGTHKVEVLARESLNETQARWYAPKKYANRATSGIEVEIDQPTDSLEIDLTWDGGKPFIENDD